MLLLDPLWPGPPLGGPPLDWTPFGFGPPLVDPLWSTPFDRPPLEDPLQPRILAFRSSYITSRYYYMVY